MKYDATTHTLTLEPRDCRVCQLQEPQGTMPTKASCPKCSGTGRGPRGGVRGCKTCRGFGYEWDHDTRQTCGHCEGRFEDFDTEGRCDYAPVEALAGVDIQVVREDRPGTWNEAHLGLGTIFSVTDYGRAREADDDYVVGKVRESFASRAEQAIKVADFDREAVAGDSAAVVETIIITVHRNGYTVTA